MKAAVEKLEVETMQQRNNNVALQQHLDHMRATLTASFQNIPLPGKLTVCIRAVYYLVRLIDLLAAFNYMNNSCAACLNIKVMAVFGHILYPEYQHLTLWHTNFSNTKRT
jgi:hypothetical protein